MRFATLDIIFVVIILVAVIRCVYRGFIAEILSMAALILGLAGAILLYNWGGGLIRKYTGLDNFNRFVAFLLIFVVIYLIVKLCEGLLHRLFDALHLDKLDRALGFFLGLIEGVLVTALIIIGLQIQPFFNADKLLNQSYISGIILMIIPYGIDLIQGKGPPNV